MGKIASGRFVVRLPLGIHEALRVDAASRGISLNEVCRRALEKYVAGNQGSSPKAEEASPVISEIRELLGDSLIGIVLFGSVAQGESREGSDIDLLVVLNRNRVLARNLYSAWDERFGSTQKSPHFVHIPGAAADAGSLWMETAVEGVVLYDRDGSVSRFLGSLGRLIASGMLKRRWAYGHPYWVRTEGEIGNVNDALASDYLKRAGHRLKALEVLMQEQSWADVVRESQELVEITLKALLRAAQIEVPRVHDVSPLLEQHREILPAGIRPRLDELVRISRFLRRDRELAFYGSEDLTPSDFYTTEDAATALGYARLVHVEVFKAMSQLKGD